MKKIKTLIIDDDDIFRFTLKELILMIEQYEFEINESPNGLTGLDMARNNSYDLIIVDLKLPDMPGAEIIANIREFDQKVPIFIVTGTPSIDSSLSMSDLNVFEYFVKPVDENEFLNAIDSIFLTL
ncbi:response regulator [Elusimicrobiota bacterium]